jgi:putative transposase
MASKERFHCGHFPKCIVLQAVFWYLRYSLSYRDIEALMKERGVEFDHATVQRWVVKYTPILETKFRKRKKAVGTPAGEWMKPTSRSKANGAICIEP